MKKFAGWWLPLLPLLVVLGLWQLAVDKTWVSSYLLPSPAAIVSSLWVDREELCDAFLITSLSAFLGFLASVSFGILFAVGISMSNWSFRAFYPYAVVFQTLPIIAIAPLLVIWFGYGMPTVVWSTFIASVFPVITSTISGLASTDPALLDLFRLYRAPRLKTLFKLVLPFAVPGILVGLRIAAGLAVIGSIVGEFVGGGGLGSVVDVARTQQRVDKVFAAVVLASALGASTIAAVNLFNWLVLRRWHAPERGTEKGRLW